MTGPQRSGDAAINEENKEVIARSRAFAAAADLPNTVAQK
jgi:hypothetical protein